MKYFLLLIAAAAGLLARGQGSTCTAPGQNPSTAFPVCGTATFVQASVPLCGGRRMPSPACGNDGLQDVNPFWYKFTCFQSGTLGFLITPNNSSSDYDWQLYDITGRNPDDVYTDGSLVIASNWSGETGNTGASTAGSQILVCAGYGKPLFSKMPQLTAGRNYLLLVSHFTNSQSGYKLSFGGGSAVITDPNEPHLQKVEANCGGDVLRVKLSKKIRCSSLSTNGSEFYLTPAVATVSGSVGIGCSAQFDTDSLGLQLSAPLPPGSYTLHIKKGGDGNTLLDYCDRTIAETENLSLTILPKAPTPMDSLTPVTCAPNVLRLVFKKGIKCSSIAADGSDFTVSGTYPVSITAGGGNCVDGLTKEVLVRLAQPLQTTGSFLLTLRRGSDGNTLIDECSEETPAGSSLSFSVKDTVNASFIYAIDYGCIKDTVSFSHPGGNDVDSWSWSLDEGQQSNLQNPQAFYSIFNRPKQVQLAVSNGFCRDSSLQTIMLINYVKAGFTAYEDNCPNEVVPVKDVSVGIVKQWAWDFGDGTTALEQQPSPIYAVPLRQTDYTVRLTVTDSFGCQSTAQQRITVYPSCYLAVPTAFTPNGDGRNDYFGVANAVKAENLEFVIFNRWGQLVYRTTAWKQGWDGRVNGQLQPTGVFVWFLRYTDRDTKKRLEQKGTVALIR